MPRTVRSRGFLFLCCLLYVVCCMPDRYYLKIGTAGDLQNKREKVFYRFLEIFPGLLSWLTIAAIILFSRLAPFWAAIFIIAFDIYWLFKSIYLSLHMRVSFGKMRANLKKDWLRELRQVEAKSEDLKDFKWQDIYHLVILPMSKEPLEVVHESFAALRNVNYPLDQFIVVLATEERAGATAQEVANKIEKEFSQIFFRFLVTTHPDGIAGEIPGKGSNESWAARKVKADVIDASGLDYRQIITSVFDVDTVVPPDFFGCLAWNYLVSTKPLHSSFQPIPLFTNNIWQAPAFARIFAFSTTFWQMIQQARPERLITFSSQSISFKALVDIDFWQTNVVSEDSRIFWQCLLYYDGDWRTVPLFFPVYMDANVAPTFWHTVKNQYKQIRRWAYGVENNPYFLFGFHKNKKIPRYRKWHLGFSMIEGAHSLATNSFIIFLLGWLPTFIGQGGFSGTLLSYNLPRITRIIMTLAMVGLVSSAVISVMILPPRPKQFGRIRFIWVVLQWILFPINIIFFGSIPALDAQTRLMFGRYMGFWVTPKHRS